MDDPDHVVEILLVHGQAREAVEARRRQEVRDRRIVRHGHDLRPRHHDLADDAVGELHGPADDDPLRFLQHAFLRGDGDEHLQLLLAVHAQLVGRTDADPREDRVRAHVHHRDERVHEPVEDVKGVGRPQGKRQRALDGEVLRRELPDHRRDVRHDREGDNEREDLESGVGEGP